MSTEKRAEGFDWQQNLLPGVFKPDAHPALAEARATRAALQNATENAVQENYGQDVRKMLGYGLAAGAGATALYHALRALRKPRGRDRRNAELVSGAPMIAKEAEFQLPNVSMSDIDKAIGGLIPRYAVPVPPGAPGFSGHDGPTDPYTFRPSWGAVAALAAGGLGAYGGNKLVNYLVKGQKKKDNEADIEDARKSYYAALRGDSKEAAALDAAYDKLREKAAEGADAAMTSNTLQQALAGAGNALTGTLQATHGLGLLAMLGSGLYGGKAVYDWTRARSAGDNLAKAQASRARMKGNPTVWVDPDELAHIKAVATAQTDE